MENFTFSMRPSIGWDAVHHAFTFLISRLMIFPGPCFGRLLTFVLGPLILHLRFLPFSSLGPVMSLAGGPFHGLGQCLAAVCLHVKAVISCLNSRSQAPTILCGLSPSLRSLAQLICTNSVELEPANYGTQAKFKTLRMFFAFLKGCK